VYLVPHTHWDREWYWTAERFGVRLEAVIDEVLDRLDDPSDLPHFLLDGQAIVLDDYLVRRPDAEARVREHVAAGRLAIGPWYVLQDEFLVSGESTVRNLLIGAERCAALGGRQDVGYVPDAFGHVGQLPQLLQQAGIDTFVFTRGSGDELAAVGSEFRWEAPDGSTVLAVKQVSGYCNAGALGFRRDAEMQAGGPPDVALAVQQVRALLARMEPHARTPLRLLNNGCDHLRPQQDLQTIVAALRESMPDVQLAVDSLQRFLSALAAMQDSLETHRGELRGGAEEQLLAGVLSSRIPLKQANERCEHLLTAVLEPLALMTAVTSSRPYPRAALDRWWRALLANHPHDSICGCSIDPVHRDMAVRLANVEDGVTTLAAELLAAHADPDAPPGVHAIAFNPLPTSVERVVERTFVLPADWDVAGVELVDEHGAPVPFAVVRADRMARFWGPEWRGLAADGQRRAIERYRSAFPQWFGDRTREHDLLATIQYIASLPALGVASVEVRPRGTAGTPAVHLPDRLAVGDGVLENDIVRVTLGADGRFTVEDKRNRARYDGLNRLEDVEDAGDLYDYAPGAESRSLSTVGMHGDVALVEDTGLRATLEVRFDWRLPQRLSPDRRRREEETVDCPVHIRVSLDRGSPIVRVALAFDNRACDHRLRALFPTGVQADTVVSDGAFNLDRRPVDPAERPDWCQPPTDGYPQRGFSAVEDGRRGLLVMGRGLHEVAASRMTDDSVRLGLTVLRAVGWLARDDLATRDRAVGPILATPDGQCLGLHRVEYAVAPFVGSLEDADVVRIAAQYRRDPLTLQTAHAATPSAGTGLCALEAPPGAPGAAVTAIKMSPSQLDGPRAPAGTDLRPPRPRRVARRSARGAHRDRSSCPRSSDRPGAAPAPDRHHRGRPGLTLRVDGTDPGP
jgi:alpha-mannosidase